jgi:hypothetical protein
MPVSMVGDVLVDSQSVYGAGHAGRLLPGQGGSARGGFDIFVFRLRLNQPCARLSQFPIACAWNELTVRPAVNGQGDLFLAGCSNGAVPDASAANLSNASVAHVR